MKKILILSVGDSPVPIVKVVSRERFYQVNNSVTFSGRAPRSSISLTG